MRTTTETFSSTVRRLGQEHRLYLDDTNAGLAEWRRVFKQLHAAADLVGLEHADADALFIEEIGFAPAA